MMEEKREKGKTLPSDSQLVARLYARDEEALVALKEKYGRLCMHIARNITGSHEDGEECTNDALLAVWHSIPPKRPENLRTYICCLARHAALNRYHYHAAVRRGGGSDGELSRRNYDVALDALAETIPAADRAEDGMEIHRLTEALNHFLRDLPVEERRIFLLRYWAGEPVKDIAAREGISAHSCTVRLSRMRGRLNRFLQEKGVY